MKAILTLISLILLLTTLPVAPAIAHNLDQGAQVFEVQCAGCHINGSNIIRRGKNLQQKTLERNGYGSIEAIAQLVTNGKGNMSAYRERLTPEEIENVAAYVLDQAAQDWKK